MSIPNVRIALSVAVAALGLAAQPALAEDPKAEPRVAATGAAPYPVSEETRICVRDTIIGSRIPRNVCNTLKGWKAKGVDPFATH